MRWAAGLAVIGVALIGGCGENATLVAARHSAYNTDREVVIAEIVACFDEHYETRRAVEDSDSKPEVDAAAGTISTPWHLLSSNASRTKRDTELRVVQGNYIRFDISVVDGPPWRVHVVSHAGQMLEGGRLMSEIPPDDGAVEMETNGIIADIHRRLEQYAVRVDN